MGRYLCLEPVLPVAMRFHASRSAVASALASPIGDVTQIQHSTQLTFRAKAEFRGLGFLGAKSERVRRLQYTESGLSPVPERTGMLA